MHRHLRHPLLWTILWVTPVAALWLLFVLLSAGSLTGVRHIHTESITYSGNCSEDDQRKTCEAAYQVSGEQFAFSPQGNADLPLHTEQESSWEALFELPTRAFDRDICVTIGGTSTAGGEVTLHLDTNNPDASRMSIINGRMCIPITENGEQMFAIDRPVIERVKLSPEMNDRIVDILGKALLNFQAGTISDSDLAALRVDVQLTSELAHPSTLKIIYLLAFILALHPVVLMLEYGHFIIRSRKALLARGL